MRLWLGLRCRPVQQHPVHSAELQGSARIRALRDLRHRHEWSRCDVHRTKSGLVWSSTCPGSDGVPCNGCELQVSSKPNKPKSVSRFLVGPFAPADTICFATSRPETGSCDGFPDSMYHTTARVRMYGEMPETKARSCLNHPRYL